MRTVLAQKLFLSPKAFQKLLGEWMDPQGTYMMGRKMLENLAILAVAGLFVFLFCFTESTDLEPFLWPDAVVGQGFPWGSSPDRGLLV